MRLSQPQSKHHRLVLTTYVGTVKPTPPALLPLVHPQANLRKFLHHHLTSPKIQALLVPQSSSTRCGLWKVNKVTVKDQHLRHCAHSACSLRPFLCGGCHLDLPGRFPIASFRLFSHVETSPIMGSSTLLTVL